MRGALGVNGIPEVEEEGDKDDGDGDVGNRRTTK